MRVVHWLLCFATSVFSLETYPVGVNLGFKFITAARFTDENKPELLSKIEGSEEYQTHMRKLASQSEERKYKFGEVYVHDSRGELVPAPNEYRGYEKKDEEIISQALRDLSNELSHKLGSSPQITTVNLPEGLDYIARDHLYETLRDSDSIPLVTKSSQMIGFLDATRSAYDLDRADGPGPKVPENPFHDDDFFVMYVDYNAYSLDIWVATISEYTASLLERGPFSLRRPDLAVSNRDDDKSKGKQIHQAIQQFIAEFSSTEEATDLQVIIVSGEASAESMESLGQSIRQIVPGRWQGIIRNELDPTFVTAIGAAHRARDFVRRPDIWKVESHDHTHDEL